MHSLNNVGLNRRRKSGASRFSMTRGSPSVEFAMVGIVFFLMLFAIMDYGWIMFAQMNIQQAVDDAGRYASTGQESAARSRIASIINVIQTEMKVPLSSWNLSICSVPAGSTTSSCYTSNNTNPTQGSSGNGAAGGPESHRHDLAHGQLEDAGATELCWTTVWTQRRNEGFPFRLHFHIKRNLQERILQSIYN